MAERNFGAWTMHPDPLWTDAAARWPVRLVSRKTTRQHLMGKGRRQLHLVCWDKQKQGHPCNQSAYCFTPDTAADGYVIDAAAILAGIMDHIRKCHETQVITAGTGA